RGDHGCLPSSLGGFLLPGGVKESHCNRSSCSGLCLCGGERPMALTRLPAQPQSRRLSAQPHTTHVPGSHTGGGKERAVSGIALAPPFSPIESVTEVLHGVSVTDPYRWLEEQHSPRTRQWIEEQTQYARSYLDNLPGRQKIRERIREFLAVETYDSLQKVGNRYYFRKRLADQEEPGIYFREGADGEVRLLLNPSELGTGAYTAGQPLRVSPDGRLLLYEIKQGGERTGTFALLEIETRTTLHDVLPRGYLRGFAFAPDGKSFYYVHEPLDSKRPFYRGACRHVLDTSAASDQEVFYAGD